MLQIVRLIVPERNSAASPDKAAVTEYARYAIISYVESVKECLHHGDPPQFIEVQQHNECDWSLGCIAL
jgi:hypothetical protein